MCTMVAISFPCAPLPSSTSPMSSPFFCNHTNSHSHSTEQQQYPEEPEQELYDDVQPTAEEYEQEPGQPTYDDVPGQEEEPEQPMYDDVHGMDEPDQPLYDDAESAAVGGDGGGGDGGDEVSASL